MLSDAVARSLTTRCPTDGPLKGLQWCWNDPDEHGEEEPARHSEHEARALADVRFRFAREWITSVQATQLAMLFEEIPPDRKPGALDAGGSVSPEKGAKALKGAVDKAES